MELTRTIENTRVAPALARAASRELADAMPAATYLDLRTVLTELVSNAVQFGPPAPIRVRLAVRRDGVIRGEVADRGDGEIEIDRSRPLERGGLGLQIVDALCSWWWAPRGSGRVRFEIEPEGYASPPVISA